MFDLKTNLSAFGVTLGGVKLLTMFAKIRLKLNSVVLSIQGFLKDHDLG